MIYIVGRDWLVSKNFPRGAPEWVYLLWRRISFGEDLQAEQNTERYTY